jgi:hypothetical protein
MRAITVALLAEVVNHSLCRLPRLIQKLEVRWIGDIGRRRARGINAERAPILPFWPVCGFDQAIERELITVVFIILS